MNELRDIVKQFIVQNFYVPEASLLSDNRSLLGTGVVDSTGVLEVVAFLERDFGVVVEDAEMIPENLDSISAIAAFVRRKTS